MQVTIRKFSETDIANKVAWINNPNSNRFLHYDLPLTLEGTQKWFERNAGNSTRYDAIMEVDGKPVGTIGLLSIDYKNKKAEFYIAMGEISYKGKGIAKQATQLMLHYAFNELGLNRVYLFTEEENIPAQKLFERIGFTQEGLLKEDIFSHNKLANRYIYSLLKKDWETHG